MYSIIRDFKFKKVIKGTFTIKINKINRMRGVLRFNDYTFQSQPFPLRSTHNIDKQYIQNNSRIDGVTESEYLVYAPGTLTDLSEGLDHHDRVYDASITNEATHTGN